MLRLLAEFYSTPWAVTPEHLMVMQSIVDRWAAGVKLSAEQLADISSSSTITTGQRRSDAPGSDGAVAVLPIYGTIAHRAYMVENICGPSGTSAERLSARFRALVADPAVKSIVLDIDSPGGSVFGINELADEVFRARNQKPIVAVANGTAASAAYWLGSAAGELIVTPSGQVGNIGVFAAHSDLSKALEAKGEKVTLVAAGKYKVERNPYEPLGEDARANMQAQVDQFYNSFVKAVARNRGVSVDVVRSSYGEGRTLLAKPALDAGMVDGIATLDETIARMQKGSKRTMTSAQASRQIAILEA